MTIKDIVTKDGIDRDFMSWLWDRDRKTYTLIMFGHIELITQEIIDKYKTENSDKNMLGC